MLRYTYNFKGGLKDIGWKRMDGIHVAQKRNK
jgi:hypothetical protein